jgi:Tol biopolymer transport system component
MAGCGGGGDGGSPNAPPDFRKAFGGFDAQNRRYSLTLVADQASTGVKGNLDGQASMLAIQDFTVAGSTAQVQRVSGTFDGIQLSLSLGAAATAPFVSSYQGAFTDADTIQLQGTGVSVELRRTGGFVAPIVGDWSGLEAAGQPWFLQVRKGDGFNDFDSVFLVSGTELLDGKTAHVEGSVTVDRIKLRIDRDTGPVDLTGEFPNVGGNFYPDTMLFGSTRRVARSTSTPASTVVYQGNGTLSATDDLGFARRDMVSVSAPKSTGFYATSLDGQRLAYVVSTSTSPSSDTLFVYDLTADTTRSVVTSPPNGTIRDLAWSPDSQYLGYTMSQAKTGPIDVYYVGRNAAVPTKASNVTATGTAAPSFKWAPLDAAQPAQIAFLANETAAAVYEVSLVRTDTGARQSLSSLAASGSVLDFQWSPKADRVAFRKHVGTVDALYVMNTTTMVAAQVPPALPAGRRVLHYAWAPSGDKIGLTANTRATQSAIYDAYVAGSDGSGSAVTLTGTGTNASVDFIAWSPDSARLALRTNNSNFLTLFAARADGTTPPTPVSDPTASMTTAEPTWRADGAALGFSATTPNGIDFEIGFVDGSAPRSIFVDALNCSDDTAWAPDGTYIAFVAGVAATKSCDVFVASSDGTKPHSLSFHTTQQRNSTTFTWMRDSKRALFLSDLDVVEGSAKSQELFVGYAAGTAAIKLSDLPGSASVVRGFVER